MKAFEYSFNLANDTLNIYTDGDMRLKYLDDFRMEFKEKFDEGGFTSLVLHMATVSYVDSAGIGSLVYLKRLCETKNIDVFIKDASESVTKVLEGAKLISSFKLI